ncbi:MAG: MarR family winged helix-turn-helix transcriptional regulator [Huintestinicola sp.]
MTESDHQLAININMLARQLDLSLSRELESMGLTLTQYRVLAFLGQSKNEKTVVQRDIEKNFMLTNPAVSGILDRLEAKGLVSRKVSSSDSRRKEITLTEEGIRLIGMIEGNARCGKRRVLSGISESELEVFGHVLSVMLDNITSSNEQN